EPKDIEELRRLIDNHREQTGSTVAARLLADWKNSLSKFKKVMPTDYKRALQEIAQRRSAGSAKDNSASFDSERAALAALPGGRI
ncbi:MAG TPA: hypothetical protein VGY55_15960, partial [Pirellulales bacterium]|nr:hypothetical protein [Pirellulales bacterium]